MRLLVVFAVVMFCVIPICQAETYTARAKNISEDAGKFGFEFDIEIKNEGGQIIFDTSTFRKKLFVSTGNLTPQEAQNAMLNKIERMTQEIWAHRHGRQTVLNNKATLEGTVISVDSFVPPGQRKEINAPR